MIEETNCRPLYWIAMLMFSPHWSCFTIYHPCSLPVSYTFLIHINFKFLFDIMSQYICSHFLCLSFTLSYLTVLYLPDFISFNRIIFGVSTYQTFILNNRFTRLVYYTHNSFEDHKLIAHICRILFLSFYLFTIYLPFDRTRIRWSMCLNTRIYACIFLHMS